MGDETDKSKVPKSQEVGLKDLQDRAVGLEGLQDQSAGRKDPEDQEDAKVAYTSLLGVKVPSPEKEPRTAEEKVEALCVNVSLLVGPSVLDRFSQLLILAPAQRSPLCAITCSKRRSLYSGEVQAKLLGLVPRAPSATSGSS